MFNPFPGNPGAFFQHEAFTIDEAENSTVKTYRQSKKSGRQVQICSYSFDERGKTHETRNNEDAFTIECWKLFLLFNIWLDEVLFCGT